MKILLLHPDDSLAAGSIEATGRPWDLVIDMGWSGRYAYSRQTERLGVRVTSIYDLLNHEQHRDRLRRLLALGMDQIVDSESVDWWDAFTVYVYPRLEQLLLLSALAENICADDAEIFATRPHFNLDALAILLHRQKQRQPEQERKKDTDDDHRRDSEKIREIPTLSRQRPSALRARAHRYLTAARTFRPAQLAEIVLDKWDTGYRLRRHFFRPPIPSSTPAILLPSAYSNVTRAQISYARMLPHRRFLLVLTRHNGRIPDLPVNVEVRSLAAYATRSPSAAEEERMRLLARWRDLQNNRFQDDPLLSLAGKLGVFDGFANFLESGLQVRDAWREVFAREPITAVLSADENNPYTRIPILLARSRKLRTVYCDHGALNMSLAYRRPVSDTYLLKGHMARNYSVSWCGLPAAKTVLGAPADKIPPASPARTANRATSKQDWIVYYSERYELSAGRTQSFYAELLPELCQLARQTHRKVILKLHPFESLRMRSNLVNRVLSPADRSLLILRDGPMAADLFDRAWCCLTVESTVAVENALHRVPCFLCSWFDSSWYNFGTQYARYGAGYPLDSPQRIREIPQLLEQFKITEATCQSLETTIAAESLEAILLGRNEKS
jgi:hypothetical protein